jgi:hypothetical protein
MAIEGEIITPERDLLLQLVQLYKVCRIEARAAKNVIDALSERDPEIAVALKAEHLKHVERISERADAEFRALEKALRGHKPYLPALRFFLESHQPKRRSQS